MSTIGECNICYSENVVVVKPTALCTHRAQTCVACVQRQLDINLNGGSIAICHNIREIPCSGGLCTSFFTEQDLQKYLTKTKLSRWNKLCFDAYLRSCEDFRWCSNHHCGSGQLVWADEDNYFTCEKCEQRTCIKHSITMHDGISCEDYDKEDTELSRSMDAIAKTSKPCPECKLSVEKTKGCDHMTCICGYQFCYSCLADWKEIISVDNSRHNKGCPWYFD